MAPFFILVSMVLLVSFFSFSFRCVKVDLFISFYYLLGVRVYATVQLSCTDDGDTRYCIDDVQYQCSLPDGDVTLRWRVFDSNNVQLGQRSYSTGDDINSVTIASVFLI